MKRLLMTCASLIPLAVLLMLAPFPLTPQPAYASTFTVTNTRDSGDGSLRWAIEQANLNSGPDLIAFNIATTDAGYNSATGVWTIQPASWLPVLTDHGTTIDGTTQTANRGDTNPNGPEIEIDGTNAGNWSCLYIESADNVVKGLVINRYNGNGVAIVGHGADNNTVIGNYIGTDASGTADLGNLYPGVAISDGAKLNTIQGNVVSGNDSNGVVIAGHGSENNTVIGNYIGTDASGTADLGNLWPGVAIFDGAKNNTIGGTTAGERNVISGNDAGGVNIGRHGTENNTVIGNYIGTDANGTADLGNGWAGVSIYDGTRSNTIGGATGGERNIISGNELYGVYIADPGTEDNTVIGNYIGTDASGTVDLGNSGSGVWILDGAKSNAIGGTTAGERNVISGNDYRGVHVSDAGTEGNTVIGNYIGTDASGTVDLGNNNSGVAITDGAKGNTIGGTTAGERNIISGNDTAGVHIEGDGTENNTVIGNYIGTDATGTADLGNSMSGVSMWGGPKGNTIGPGNTVANNGGAGVGVKGSGSTGNTITENSITNNAGLGINNVDGGNNELAPPVITSVTASVSGTACPNCRVEIFSDPADEGKVYEGFTTADGTGNFTWAGSPVGPNVRATATDADGNTSEFTPLYVIYLPIVLMSYQ